MLARHALIAALVVAALALAACGGDDDDDGASPTATSTEQQAAAPEAVSTNTDEKPKVPKPSGEPPAELQKEDVVEGDGTREARKGDNVSVQYVGVNFSTGDQFDASWDRGEPFTFTLGSGQVIQGWDEGVAGMKAGGRRVLTIPPDLGYGAQGQPPAIPPNETLVFVVDLVKIDRPR